MGPTLVPRCDCHRVQPRQRGTVADISVNRQIPLKNSAGTQEVANHATTTSFASGVYVFKNRPFSCPCLVNNSSSTSSRTIYAHKRQISENHRREMESVCFENDETITDILLLMGPSLTTERIINRKGATTWRDLSI